LKAFRSQHYRGAGFVWHSEFVDHFARFGGVLGLEVKKNLLVPANRVVKRMLDYTIALPLLIVSAPFLPLSPSGLRS